jgi:hypothetical protein
VDGVQGVLFQMVEQVEKSQHVSKSFKYLIECCNPTTKGASVQMTSVYLYCESLKEVETKGAHACPLSQIEPVPRIGNMMGKH